MSTEADVDGNCAKNNVFLDRGRHNDKRAGMVHTGYNEKNSIVN